ESLLLAAYLFPQPKPSTASAEQPARHALDFGSGAGFPGLPLKIYVPDLFLTLAESSQKKAAFLAEAIRSLRLTNAAVFSGRIGLASGKERVPQLPPGIAPLDLVTLRAVERFDSALGSAAAFIRYSSGQSPAGKLALLIGRRQLKPVAQLLPDFIWDPPVQVPQSHERVLLVGKYRPGNVS
ncbi:MAG TPA: RsmG family class I SAM-dependent methyltransferase, partial [Terriglobales bacterium]|nr:RsmG family class I SAM-dependent methyltransferase [Terriglobales bacterium]